MPESAAFTRAITTRPAIAARTPESAYTVTRWRFTGMPVSLAATRVAADRVERAEAREMQNDVQDERSAADQHRHGNGADEPGASVRKAAGKPWITSPFMKT